MSDSEVLLTQEDLETYRCEENRIVAEISVLQRSLAAVRRKLYAAEFLANVVNKDPAAPLQRSETGEGK